jgi:predicted GIY-YIG superfamily endonuclease
MSGLTTQKMKKLHKNINPNLGHRMKQHKAELLYFEKFANKHDAAKKEREIK